jgi:hypothetical protein
MKVNLHVFFNFWTWWMGNIRLTLDPLYPRRKRDGPKAHGDEETNYALCTNQTPVIQYVLTGLYLRHNDPFRYLDTDGRIILK